MPDDLLGTAETPVIIPTSDEKTLALLSHVLTFIFPFIAPLIIYLVKKDESSFVAYHAKESLNFQITLFILGVIFCVLIIVIVGIFLLWIEGIAATVLIIVATIRAAEGKLYKYPFCIRLIK
jgi:uncharacterized Tic20 family protein